VLQRQQRRRRRDRAGVRDAAVFAVMSVNGLNRLLCNRLPGYSTCGCRAQHVRRVLASRTESHRSQSQAAMRLNADPMLIIRSMDQMICFCSSRFTCDLHADLTPELFSMICRSAADP